MKSNIMQADNVVQHTFNWLEKVVIGLNFCPFAKREVLRNSIRYQVCESNDFKTALLMFMEELTHLDEQDATETTLLIFPNLFQDFNDYWDLVSIAETLLAEQGYEGIYQLATFHPEYCFGDAEEEDAANYTNRSPYPMLHILREASLENALEHYPDPEEIPERNMAVAREKGAQALQQLLENCFKS